MMVPGYLLVVYVCEPPGMLGLPYVLGLARVKSDPSLSRGVTVEVMSAPILDIINPFWSDIMINGSLMFFWLTIPSRSTVSIFTQWICILIYVYFVTKWRVLKVNRRVEHDDRD